MMRENPTQSRFFDELKDWSAIKLRIVTKYLVSYLRVRAGSHRIIYYIDGFAGAGVYAQDGHDPQEGSPIRLARLAQKLAESSKPCRLKCINVEKDFWNFESLQRTLADFDSTLVQVRLGSFEDHVEDICHKIGRAPAVFFLDPFGPSPLTLDKLRLLLVRNDTELLLTVMTPYLHRLAGFGDSVAKESQAKRWLLSEILGESPTGAEPEWYIEWRHRRDASLWDQWALATYTRRLCQRSPHLRYAVSYAVREAYGAPPKYYLVFATRHSLAVEIMNDLLCTEDEELFAQMDSARRITQPALTGFLEEVDEIGRQRKIADLMEHVSAFGVKERRATRQSIWWHFMTNGMFGVFKKKHYREAVDALVRMGRARYRSNRRPKDDTLVEFL